MHSLISILSLAGMQGLNFTLYGTANDRGYSTSRLISRMHRHITIVLKNVRKDTHEKTGWHLAMGFSWTLGLANRLHINLDDLLWENFPGHCPYCLEVPCGCKERPLDRSRVERAPSTSRPATLQEYQAMFARIYPNTLQNAAMHLAEEAGEVDIAVEVYDGTHDCARWEAISLELADTVTTFFAVATALNLDLASEMEKWFKNGCPGCMGNPCSCNFNQVRETV